MYERRPTRGSGSDSQVTDYNIVKTQQLIDGHVEKYCHFAGVVKDINPHIDITNRTDVLRLIDMGKQHGHIIYHNVSERLSVFSLSVNNIKIIPVRNEELPIFLRISMQEIAAICYIKDDAQHILAIKYGSTILCHLAVLYVDSKHIAEEICSLVDVCFQLIYMEAAIDIIDTSNPGDSSRSNSTGSANPPFISPSFRPISQNDVNQNPSRPSSIRRHGRRVPSDPSTRGSDTGSIFQELLHDYMVKLHQKLNSEELRQFASYLPQLTKSKNEFEEFCEKIYDLYGPNRIYLLAEMSPFIPQDNYPHFEEFLRSKGLPLPDSGTISSAHSNPALSAPFSDSGLGSGNESLEHIMQIMSHVHTLDASNDVDYSPDKFMPGPDYNS
ncbi:hypothetical protein LOTGIDRAFT_118823 [Lottia gigantea]|uniref:Cerebral cavernous malformations 2 harmonin-homology domain-containing protein n=1 Tax=Lottia gigantea TaxID=225164 RepID=V4AGS8_LOTGI|nr:hypothetical protein LOTGIDRAFT_118823 [Lottia gigantea]ESO94335.1 hypothetical protein LOTGIDRAFT_118823 [Lottia gigantea]